MTSFMLFVRNTTRVSLAVAFVAMIVLTGCFKRQQATNTNTASENTNTKASATSTATENGGSAKNDAAKQDGGQKEDRPANTNANVSNTNTAEGPPAPLQAPSLTLTLGAENNSQQTGLVVITDIGEGKSHVTVRITGAPLNTPQPANIHAGMCASLGPVRHALNNIVNGSSDTVLLLPYETLISQVPFSVSVRKSNPEYFLLVACGDKL